MLKYIYIFSKMLLSNFLKDLITSQLLAAEQFNELKYGTKLLNKKYYD